MLDFLLDILFPKHCVSCGKWGKFICNQCVSKIEFFDNQVCPYCERLSPYGFTHPRCAKPHGLDGMFVLAHFRGPIRKALHEIKYRGTYAAVSGLVGQLVSKYHRQFDFDYLVPIPLHPKRERERGFNQAEKLASALARNLGEIQDARLKIQEKKKENGSRVQVINLLQRTRETKPQFDLKQKDRMKNVQNAFSLSDCHPLTASPCKNRSFCLVDDVATTGSTIFECAKVLKRAGAKKVWAICVARGG